MQQIVIALLFLSVMQPMAQADEPESALERYGRLSFPESTGGLDWKEFDKGWKDRVAAEFDIVNDADLISLRTGLRDERPHVRAMAARALGILADRASAEALAELVRNDPSYLVRIRAVESLGFLKMKSDAIELAKKDEQGGVRWSARLAAEQLERDDDYAAEVRRAFAVGIQRDAMDAAKVGQPAPDFAAQTMDGKPFRLSSVLGKKPVAIYFAAFDA